MLPSLRIPIIQAPMLGASTAAMAAAVCRAGGLGSLPPGLSPAALTQAVEGLRRATDRPFAVNLFVLDAARPDEGQVAAAVTSALERLAPYHRELGLPPPRVPARWAEDFAAQLDAVVACAPAVASFTFGCLSAQQVARLHAAGTAVIGTATTVAEARAWAAVGADAVCAQGSEAGGHRGTFLRPVEESLIGTLALVPAICDAVAIPVIAAGGIMDGRGIAAALSLGAWAVQLGTAFLLTDEAATNPAWRRAIAATRAPRAEGTAEETAEGRAGAEGEDPTRLTRAFSGRTARGIENRFMRELRAVEQELPDYPIQNALTQELRAAASRAGRADLLSLWAGQGVRQARALGAEQLVGVLWREAQEAAAATLRRTQSGG
ncbi:MAG: nitronate monooxygenase [Polyangia bacterium]